MNRQFLNGAVAIATALLSTSAFAAPSSLTDAYMASLMTRCVNNGGLDPVAVPAMNDDALLRALTECANRNAAVAPSQAPAPEQTYARPKVAAASPDYGYSQAPSYSPAPAEAGASLLEAVRTIGPILIGNRFGGGGGGGGGPIGGPTDPTNDPTVPVNSIHARFQNIKTAFDQCVQSSACTSQEAAALGAGIARFEALNANLGDSPAARLQKQRALDALARATNQFAHNDTGIPNPDIIARMKAKRASLDPKTGKPVVNGLVSPLQPKALEALKAKAGNNPTQLSAKTGEKARGTKAMLQRREAFKSAKARGEAGRDPIAHTSKVKSRPHDLQRKENTKARSQSATRASAPGASQSQPRSGASTSKVAGIARR